MKNGLEFARSYECVTSEEKRRGHSNDKGNIVSKVRKEIKANVNPLFVRETLRNATSKHKSFDGIYIYASQVLPNLITKLRARRAEIAPKESKLGVRSSWFAQIHALSLTYTTSPQAPA